jgi:hypothetical protein
MIFSFLSTAPVDNFVDNAGKITFSLCGGTLAVGD